MPVFMLTSPAIKPDKTDPSSNTSKPEEKQPATTEPKEVIPAVGEVTPKTIDENTVLLDGPLSQVYTEVLLKMYAKESYIPEQMAITEVSELPDPNNTALNAQASYVYVLDDKDLDSSYGEIFNDLVCAAESHKHVYLCIEHSHHINLRSVTMLEYAEKAGFKVLYNRDQAIELITSKMKPRAKS